MNGILFILFGATGDLARRKLMPALYRLVLEKKLADVSFFLVGREESTVEAIFTHTKPFIGDIDASTWRSMMERSLYHQCDLTKSDTYEVLHDRIQDAEATWKTTNRLVYCAVASDFFCAITEGLARTGILQKTPPDGSWHRIVYEKPFGRDQLSAHCINESIERTLSEQQIFRIDHYLTKEIVNNIALIRFTNAIFEPLWNNQFVDYIEIILSEKISIESQGGYYDTYGALRDVVQNHMLQLLALIAMEPPVKLTGDYIRDKKADVLQQVTCVDGILGQYQGYTDDVHSNMSGTETFAALKLSVNNQRWAGVPFFLKTGRALDVKETVINIIFKPVTCLLTKQCPPDANVLSIRVAPDATFSLTLNAKKPGEADTLIPISMDYCHSCRFAFSPSHEYEFLLQEVMRGEQAVSVRADEIEYAWRLIDTIYARHLPLYFYTKGSKGPQELNQFSVNNGMRWHI